MHKEIIIFDCNNNKLKGILKFPEGSKSRQLPVVVMSSGYGGNGSLSKTWTTFENIFLHNNLCTLTFDFMGQGNSEGNISNLTPLSALDNLKAFIEKIKKDELIDKNRISLFGSSFGGYVAMLYSAIYADIKILALKSPVSDYAEVRNIQLGLDGVEKWRKDSTTIIDGTKTNFEFYAQSIAIDIYTRIAPIIKCPTFIVHGDADSNVPITQSIKLCSIIKDAKLEIISGANHGYKEGDSFNKMTNIINQWISQNI